jgi:hypothetical protein
MQTGVKKNQWIFYARWLVAGIASLMLSFLFSWIPLFLIRQVVGDFILVAGVNHVTEDYMLGYAFIPSFGIFMGGIQYALLRQRLAPMGWWIFTTALGWSLAWLGISLRYNPLGPGTLSNPGLAFALAGTLLGLLLGWAQWRMLRRHVSRAIWWIPANMLAFAIAGLLISNVYGWYEALAAFTLPSLITGIVLWAWLDRSQ